MALNRTGLDWTGLDETLASPCPACVHPNLGRKDRGDADRRERAQGAGCGGSPGLLAKVSESACTSASRGPVRWKLSRGASKTGGDGSRLGSTRIGRVDLAHRRQTQDSSRGRLRNASPAAYKLLYKIWLGKPPTDPPLARSSEPQARSNLAPTRTSVGHTPSKQWMGFYIDWGCAGRGLTEASLGAGRRLGRDREEGGNAEWRWIGIVDLDERDGSDGARLGAIRATQWTIDRGCWDDALTD